MQAGLVKRAANKRDIRQCVDVTKHSDAIDNHNINVARTDP